MSFFDINFSDILDVGTTIGATLLSTDAAQNAANAQAGAANKSAQVQQNIYDQNRKDLFPYRDVGQNALYQLSALEGVDYADAPGTLDERMENAFSRFAASPDYQFGMTEGISALDRSAAANGKLQSGQQMKAINRFGQDYAGAKFGEYKNSLARLSGVGQTATNTGVASGQNFASNYGNALQSAGQARASGYAGQANAINQGASNLLYQFG